LTYLRHGHRDRPAGVYGGVVEGSLVADHHDEAGYRVADDGDYGVTEAVGGAGPERLGRADLDQRFGHVAHVSIAPPVQPDLGDRGGVFGPCRAEVHSQHRSSVTIVDA
jgi:hypothetical protein